MFSVYWMHVLMTGVIGFWCCKLLMASNVVNLYLVELDYFIALLSALLSLWWSSILLNLFFVSWFVLLKFVLCFSAFDFSVFCSMVCVVEVCLVVLVWLWKWGLLFCCVWFMVCIFLLLWKFDLLGLFCLLVCDFSMRGRFC